MSSPHTWPSPTPRPRGCGRAILTPYPIAEPGPRARSTARPTAPRHRPFAPVRDEARHAAEVLRASLLHERWTLDRLAETVHLSSSQVGRVFTVPGVLAASVAAVPPLVLLAITHLTVILTRPIPHAPREAADADTPELAGASSRRELAESLRAQGWSNKTIARHVGVHPSTVGRWFARPALTGPEEEPV